MTAQKQAQKEKEKFRDPVYPQALIPMHPAFGQDDANFYGESAVGVYSPQGHKITGDVRTYHAQANGPNQAHSRLAAQANGSEFAVVNQIQTNRQYEDSQQSVVNQQLINNSHLEIGNFAPQSLNAQPQSALPAQSHAQQTFGRQNFASPAYRQMNSCGNLQYARAATPFPVNEQYFPVRNHQQVYQVPAASQYQQIQQYPISNLPPVHELPAVNNYEPIHNSIEPFVQNYQGYQGVENIHGLDSVHSIRAEFQPECNTVGNGYLW